MKRLKKWALDALVLFGVCIVFFLRGIGDGCLIVADWIDAALPR